MATRVYRVIPIDKAANLHLGDIVPIPKEDKNFICAESKAKVEDVFETKRINIVPDYPSRKACLFVFPFDKDIIENFLCLAHSHNSFDYALLSLDLTGTLIWCDMDKFTVAGTPLGTKIRDSLAREYWESAGADYSDFGLPEGLFVGQATIVNIEQHHYKGL